MEVEYPINHVNIRQVIEKIKELRKEGYVEDFGVDATGIDGFKSLIYNIGRIYINAFVHKEEWWCHVAVDSVYVIKNESRSDAETIINFIANKGAFHDIRTEKDAINYIIPKSTTSTSSI